MASVAIRCSGRGRGEWLPVAVFIEDTERLSEFLFAVRLLHLFRHHVQKLVEIDRTIAYIHSSNAMC